MIAGTSVLWPAASVDTPTACTSFSIAWRAHGGGDIVVFVGGVIPKQDYAFLDDAGVKGIYGPGTPIPVSAKDVLEQIRKAQG